MKVSESLRFLTLLFSFSTVLAAQAWASGDDAVVGSRYVSARGAAMGDAVIPLADDGASGLFYNPAAIARLQKATFEPINLQGQFGHGYFRNVSTSNFYNATSLSGYAPTLTSTGSTTASGVSLLPNFSMRGFAIGVLASMSGYAKGTSSTQVQYTSRYQLIPSVGFALPLAQGIVRIGYVLQWVNLAKGTNTVTTGGSIGYDQGLKEGAGLSHNLGYALTIPFSFLPSFNAVARNVGKTKFNQGKVMALSKNSNGSPADEDMSVDLGMSLSPKLGPNSVFNFSAVARDITNKSKISWLARAAVGIEFDIRHRLYVRGGFGSGYPSAGLAFRTNRGELSLAWFSQELGNSVYDKRDMRFVFQYQLRLF